MAILHQFLDALATGDACLVLVERTQGSAPRECGAWMAVFNDQVIGTVGGGHVEWQAIERARTLMADASLGRAAAQTHRYALGPSLGQCCGGVMYLSFENVRESDVSDLRERLSAPLQPVALFGGGHVGHALARVLAPLPFALTWIDSRDGVFPSPPPVGVVCEYSDPVQASVPLLEAQSEVLIMSFSHAEDLDVVAACLIRKRAENDLRGIGLIGSATKWATFRSRLRHRGFSEQEIGQITCPIGVPGIAGKQPAVIAVAVAAQLLQRLGPLPDRDPGMSTG